MSTQPPSGADRSFNRSMLFKLVAVFFLGAVVKQVWFSS